MLKTSFKDFVREVVILTETFHRKNKLIAGIHVSEIQVKNQSNFGSALHETFKAKGKSYVRPANRNHSLFEVDGRNFVTDGNNSKQFNRRAYKSLFFIYLDSIHFPYKFQVLI